MPWIYILECADGSYYVGSTVDLERRVWEHDVGLGSGYTRRPGRRPVKLRWSEWFTRVDQAFAFEKQVQGWGRAKREALMEGRYDDLPALARNREERERAAREEAAAVSDELAGPGTG